MANKVITKFDVDGTGSNNFTIRPTHAYMGTCTTAGSTAAKTVTITPAVDNFLEAGVRITVYFSNANNATNPTLSINSGTAKKIYKGSSAINAKLLSIGYHDFIYDGTQWQYVSSYIDTNTTYDNLSASNTNTSNHYTVPGAGSNTGYFLRGDGSWKTPANTTYGVFKGSNDGLVPNPGSAQNNTNHILSGDGTWIWYSGEVSMAVDEYRATAGSMSPVLGTVLPIDYYGRTNYIPYFYEAEPDGIQVLVPRTPTKIQYAIAVGMDDKGHLFIPITDEFKTMLIKEMGYTGNPEG